MTNFTHTPIIAVYQELEKNRRHFFYLVSDIKEKSSAIEQKVAPALLIITLKRLYSLLHSEHEFHLIRQTVNI